MCSFWSEARRKAAVVLQLISCITYVVGISSINCCLSFSTSDRIGGHLFKTKSKVLYLGMNNLRHQCTLESSSLESCFADCEPAASSWQKGQQYLGLHQEEHCQQVEGGEFSSLLIPGEAASGVLFVVLGSPVQKRYGLTGASLE